MNVIFHTTVAVGIAVLINETQQLARYGSGLKQLGIGSLAFAVGVVSHGVLDYIPHCYPINSKLDVIASSLFMGVALVGVRWQYKLILGMTFLGCIFPDLIDLAPAILNKYVGTNLPIIEKIFPWHIHEYSGSIFAKECRASPLNYRVSFLNHGLVVLTVAIVCWARSKDAMAMIFGPSRS